MERNEFSRATLQQAAEGVSIDYKRVLYRAWRYWYIIALSFLTALVIVFLTNRYSTRIYPITASVIVKEVEDVSGSEILYNNPLVNFHRNYLNETYIIKSYPLIQRVIEDLNFDATFFREGNILTTEIYDFPLQFFPLRKEMKRSMSCQFRLESEDSFVLESGDVKKKFKIGDTVRFEQLAGIVKLRDSSKIKENIGSNLILNYTPSMQLASRYVGSVNATWAEEGAGVLNLSILGSNIRKELDFMNGLISVYQEFDLENKNQTAYRTVNFISDQLKNISDSLLRVERKLEQFKSKNSASDFNAQTERLFKKMESFESEMVQLQIRKNYFEYLQKYLTKNENLDQVILPSSMGVEDPVLNNLLNKLAETQISVKLRKRAENPIVVEEQKRGYEMKREIMESVKSMLISDQVKADFINKQIANIDRELGYLPTTQRALISIQRNYSLLENLYIYLLQKRSEAAITQASNTSDIVVVNPPRAGGPISPRTASNYALGIFLSIALPFLIFVLFEFLDTRVQSKEDVERITSIPFIGGVGHKKTDANLAVFKQPKSVIAESFRALRSNLNYFLAKKDKSVVLVTSSISGEGKTFTSLNLASVYALSGKKTLIVGADMRRPKLFAEFNFQNDIGLSNYLANLTDFASIVKKTDYENLDLISGGVVPPNPSELLLSERMSQFMEEAKQAYDCVIIDTPPMAIVTDAFVLTPYADHTLFLVRQNYTPRNLLRTVEDYHAGGKLKNISIVLNDISRTGPGYGFGYGYAYSYGYGYGYGESKNSRAYYEE